MKVLVTGATGGLGELVIKSLLEKGIRVIATSRDEKKAEKASFYPKVTYKPLDFNSSYQHNLFEYFDSPDLLIHLAWEKLNEYKNPEHTSVILENHKRFVSNLFKNGLKDICGVGTCYEYGIREGELEENMPSEPVLPYPEGKNKFREFLEELQVKYKFSYKWVRVFYVFGEVKGRKNLYTLIMEAIAGNQKVFNMSGGEQVRDFLSPAEISERIIKIALQNKTQGVINCCSGKPVKLKDFVQDFLNKHNYELELNLGFYPYADYEPMVTWGSVTKLNNSLNQK